ncbi:MAG: hypothetical protein WCG75_13030, partial [Armatimonadota bacterium]
MKLIAFTLPLILCAGLLMGCKNDGKTSNDPVDPTNNSAKSPGESHGPEPLQKEICFAAQNSRVPILMYHDLIEERIKGSLW